MEYSRKLWIAKILIMLATLLYTFEPLLVDLSSTHSEPDIWSMHGRFHWIWGLSSHVIAFPILMYLLWGNLHGTGRSVRVVAFLGMAYALGFFVTATFGEKFGAQLHDSSHEHPPYGGDGEFSIMIISFALLCIGVLFSIKRGESLE